MQLGSLEHLTCQSSYKYYDSSEWIKWVLLTSVELQSISRLCMFLGD